MLGEREYSSVDGHKLGYMHHHTMHVWGYMLATIHLRKLVDKCFWLRFKVFFTCSAVRSSCHTESIRLTSKRSHHKVCTSSQSGISGNVAIMLSFSNTINFSGPVRVRHFSFFDSHPIQKENPLIPRVFKVLSYFLIYCSCSRLFTLVAFSILSRHFSSNNRRSINTSATRRNV